MRNPQIGIILKMRRIELDRDVSEIAEKLAPEMNIAPDTAYSLFNQFENGYIFGTTSARGIKIQGAAHLDRLARYMEELAIPVTHEVVWAVKECARPIEFDYPLQRNSTVRYIRQPSRDDFVRDARLSYS